MIDINRYEIDDDVVWIWNDSDDAYDEEKKQWVSGVEHSNWQLWEYKECPAEKGGYRIYREGEDDERTHVPNQQLLPDMPQIEWHKKMEAIQDVPFLIRKIKEQQDALKQQQDALKQQQDALKEAVWVVKEMEGMAYAGADADKFANHALEFIGNVKEMIE